MKLKIKYYHIILCISLAWIILPAKSLSKTPLNLHGRYDYSQGWYHRVQKGDTLDKLAKKYNRSQILIAQVNGLNPRKSLNVGLYLYIPPTNKASVIKQSAPVVTNPSKTNTQSSSVSPKPPFRVAERSSQKDKTYNRQQGSATSRSKSRSSSSVKNTAITSSAVYNRKVSSRGFIWPVSGKVTKAFSDSKRAPHKGIDISAKKGTIVWAAKSGKVIYSDDEIPGYGKLIIIDHGDKITSVYAHNSDLLVNVGKYVIQGTPIARVGDTGRANGPYLHFEIRKKAVCVNPLAYLP